MSDPISNFDSRVFRALLRPEFEYRDVDEATARAAANHYICFRRDGMDVEHHVFARGRRFRHDYFDHRPPAEDLIRAHRDRWPNVPFDLVEVAADGATRTRYQHDANGEYVLRIVFELDAAKNPTSQTMFAPDGAFVERQEYEYDEEGEICRTRLLDEDGTVLADDET